MGFTETLTLIFIILKLTHTIDWPWPIVLLPELIAAGLYLLAGLGSLVGFFVFRRR